MFKPLQWVSSGDEWKTELAETTFGMTYEVYNRGNDYYAASRDGLDEFAYCDTLEEAKQACEANYYKRMELQRRED